jgi:hypothetical protein
VSETNDRCPRCSGGFHCGVNDAGPCACTTVTLDPKTLADLRERYTSCLCLRCLIEISELSATKEEAGPV